MYLSLLYRVVHLTGLYTELVRHRGWPCWHIHCHQNKPRSKLGTQLSQITSNWSNKSWLMLIVLNELIITDFWNIFWSFESFFISSEKKVCWMCYNTIWVEFSVIVNMNLIHELRVNILVWKVYPFLKLK